MTITWTQTDPTVKYWTPSGTGLQDYDIYTNQSIPKDAVALIACCNGNEATDVDLGVQRQHGDIYEQLGSSLTDVLSGEAGDKHRVGQRLNFTGTIDTFYFRTWSHTGNTGTIYYRIRKVSDDSIIAEVSEDVSAIGSSHEWHKVKFASPVSITEEVRIMVEFSGGDATHKVYMFRFSGAVSGSHTAYISSYTDTSSESSQMAIFSYEPASFSAVTDRHVLVHEAEGGGEGTVIMLVTVEPITGYIKTYCSTTTGVTFRVLGYLTGVTFTEQFDNTPCPQFSGSWYDLYISYSGGSIWVGESSKVYQFLLCNGYPDTVNSMGIRNPSSSLDRRISVDEAEGGTNALNCFSTLVKTDVDGHLKAYSDYITVATTQRFINLGYFDNTLDFHEGWIEQTEIQSEKSDGTWIEKQFASAIYKQPNWNIDSHSFSASVTRIAERITSATGHFSAFGVYIRSISGSPTGNLYARVRDASTDNILAEGYIDISTVSVGLLAIDYDEPVDLSADDVYFSLEYDNADESNSLGIYQAGSNPFVGGSGYLYNGSWSEYNSLYDLVFYCLHSPSNGIQEYVLGYDDAGAEGYCGVRPTGSSQSDYILVHEAEGGGLNAIQMLCQPDVSSNGVHGIELICGDNSESKFYYSGYFIEAVTGATTTTSTYSIDSILKKLDTTINYSSDVALKNLDVMKTYSIDVLEGKVNLILDYLVDALLKSDITKPYLIETLIKKLDTTQTYSVDQLISVIDNVSDYLIDTLTQKLDSTTTYSADSILKKLDTATTYLLETLIEKLDTETTYDLDLLIQKLDTAVNYSIDILTKETDLTNTYEIDTIYRKTVTADYLLDLIQKKEDVPSEYLIDFIISLGIQTDSINYLIEALLKRDDDTKEYTLDTIFRNTDVKTYLLEALLRDTSTKTFLMDLLISNPTTLDYLIDSLFKKLDTTQIYTIDLLLQKLDTTKTYDVDTLIKKLDTTQTYLLESLIKKLDTTSTYSVDQLLALIDTTNYDVDVILKKLDTTLTYSIDTLIQELELTDTYLLDSLFKKLDTMQTYSIDSLISEVITSNYSIDLLISTQDLFETYDIDTVISRIISTNYSVDALLRNSVPLEYLIDVFMQGSDGLSYLADVMFKKNDTTTTYLIEGAFQRTGDTSTYLLESLLTNVETSQYLIDYIMTVIPEVPYLIEAVFKRNNDTMDFFIDLLLSNPTTSDVLVDTILMNPSIKDYYIDTLLSTLDAETIFALDVVINKTDSTDYLIDYLSKKENVTVDYITDVVIQTEDVKTYFIDAIIAAGVSSSTENYFVDAIFTNRLYKNYMLDTIVKAFGVTKQYLVDCLLGTEADFKINGRSRRHLRTYRTTKLNVPIAPIKIVDSNNMPIKIKTELLKLIIEKELRRNFVDTQRIIIVPIKTLGIVITEEGKNIKYSKLPIIRKYNPLIINNKVPNIYLIKLRRDLDKLDEI